MFDPRQDTPPPMSNVRRRGIPVAPDVPAPSHQAGPGGAVPHEFRAERTQPENRRSLGEKKGRRPRPPTGIASRLQSSVVACSGSSAEEVGTPARSGPNRGSARYRATELASDAEPSRPAVPALARRREDGPAMVETCFDVGALIRRKTLTRLRCLPEHQWLHGQRPPTVSPCGRECALLRSRQGERPTPAAVPSCSV